MNEPILAIKKQEYIWIRHFVLGPFEGDNLTKEFNFSLLRRVFFFIRRKYIYMWFLK